MGTPGVEKLGPYQSLGIKRWVRVHPRVGVTEPAPVLVMFDAQNLYGDEGSFAGGWHLHDTVERLAARGLPAPVIVGIDHGNEHRLHELSPFKEARSHGRFPELLDWICDTLLPRIRARYHVRTDREGTFIGGSSMGGLATLHAVLQRPDVFGGGLSMSPSVWFADKAILASAKSSHPPRDVRLYLDAGGKEDKHYAVVRNTEAMAKALLSRGFPPGNLRMVIDPEGKHSEPDWRRRAPAALEFLLEGLGAARQVDAYAG
jgi:predicted alpha/beta superfamily hydrolase